MGPCTCTANELAALATEWGSSDRAVVMRACISKSYYAAYHAAHDLASLVPGDDSSRGPKGGLGHREVARRLRNWGKLPVCYARLRRFAPIARVAGDQLLSAIASREHADYLLADFMSASEVELQLLRMRKIFEFVSTVEPEFQRLQA